MQFVKNDCLIDRLEMLNRYIKVTALRTELAVLNRECFLYIRSAHFFALISKDQ